MTQSQGAQAPSVTLDNDRFCAGWQQAFSRDVCEGEGVIRPLPNLQTLCAPPMVLFCTKRLVRGVAQGPPSQNTVFWGDGQSLKGREMPVHLQSLNVEKQKNPSAIHL